jgi:molybdopterin-guanine dinucleotide biosynthesis protein A
MLSKIVSSVPLTGVILAGGRSRRLGQDKALLELAGIPLLVRVMERLQSMCDDIIIAGQLETRMLLPGARIVGDLLAGSGALGGIHSGLSASRTPYSLVVACDMPFLSTSLLRYMIRQIGVHDDGAPDVVIPRINGYTEPLHALYSCRCLKPIEEYIEQGGGRIVSFFSRVRVRYVEAVEVDRFDPEHRSFFNINTPDDWLRAQNWVQEEVG